MKKIFLGCWLLLAYGTAFSQAQESHGVRVFGVVIDSVYQLPISDVNITTKRYGTISADNGIFSLLLSSGDSIQFSHVGYRPFVFVYYAGLHNNLKIALIPKVRVLKEVRVLPFDTEEAFKSKLLEGDAVESEEEAAAKETSAKLKGLGALAPAAPVNNLDRFEAEIQGPQDVTFFSSSPSKGVLKMLKGNPGPKNSSSKNPAPANFNTWSADTLKPGRVKQDSVRRKSIKPEPRKPLN